MALHGRLGTSRKTGVSGVSSAGIVVVLALVLGLVLSVSAAGLAQPIRIGLQGPITGAWALEGEMAVNSVQVVADQINARGGVLGRPIEIVIGDDQGEVRQSALTAQRKIGRASCRGRVWSQVTRRGVRK